MGGYGCWLGGCMYGGVSRTASASHSTEGATGQSEEKSHGPPPVLCRCGRLRELFTALHYMFRSVPNPGAG